MKSRVELGRGDDLTKLQWVVRRSRFGWLTGTVTHCSVDAAGNELSLWLERRPHAAALTRRGLRRRLRRMERDILDLNRGEAIKSDGLDPEMGLG